VLYKEAYSDEGKKREGKKCLIVGFRIGFQKTKQRKRNGYTLYLKVKMGGIWSKKIAHPCTIFMPY